MGFWERLCGAVIAGLFVASMMSRVEAMAASAGSDDLAAEADRAGQALVREVIALGNPGQQTIDYLVEYPEAAAQVVAAQ